MNNEQIKPNSEERQQQASTWASIIFIALGAAFLAFSLYVVFGKQQGRFDLSDKVLMPMAVIMLGAGIASYRLIQRGSQEFGSGLLFILGVLIPPLAAVFTLKGFGVTSIVYIVLMASIMIEFILPKHLRRAAIIASIITVLFCIGIELANPAFRVATDIYRVINTFTILAGLGLLAFYARQYPNFPLRVKLLVSILVVSILSVALIGYFAYSRFQVSQTFLTGELQNTVTQQSQQQLNYTAQAEANQADQTLLAVATDVEKLAGYRSKLYSKSTVLETGAYWDGHTQLVQLSGRQYGNSKSDVASVFIPNTISLNDSMISDLNITAYMDFIVPATMKSDQTMVAVYFISESGATTYYPNINLAESVPANFDPRTQPFYRIATPANNPQRKVVWSEPYQDPAGTGLIVTSAAPVYDQNNQFRGVLAADVQLVKIADQIGTIRVGQTGFAFLIDPAGHLIAMHEASTNAFRVFGLSYEPLAPNEAPKQTVLGQGPTDLQVLTRHMVAGDSGLGTTILGKIQYYVAYTPLPTIGYSLGLIVPTSELNAPFSNAQKQIQSQTSSTLNLSIAILILVLMISVGMSVFLSQSISKPLVELTNVVEQISLGNLGMRAPDTAQDETGTLARVFNNMTTQLRDLIGKLEQRVADRTKALTTSTQISRRLSTILDQKKLVKEVVEQVQSEFGYYHAHIYLVDEASGDMLMAGGTGEAGITMLANGHRVAQGKGLVGRAAETNKTVLVSDTSQDHNWLPNPLLPETRAEIAVPISAGEQTLGVLDIQHNVVGGLGEQDADLLGSIASQVAIALQNTRQYADSTRFKMGIERSGDAVFTTDIKGVINYANPAFEKVYGYTPEEVIGKTPRIIKSGLLTQEVYQSFWGALLSKNTVTGELVNKHKDGHLVNIAGTNSAIVDEAGDIIGFLAVHHDITEQKRAQELGTQRARQQESLNLITQRIQSTTSIEAALQIAARELGHALGMKSIVQISDLHDSENNN
ncbi:MAG: PAS domain S-box protein [Chloroflexi bacterium]|nr:PAS domain S-box protein [Chloroflexota bacterium]